MDNSGLWLWFGCQGIQANVNGGSMIKTVGIVSLSSGIVGEPFIRFEADIGIRRLKDMA